MPHVLSISSAFWLPFPSELFNNAARISLYLGVLKKGARGLFELSLKPYAKLHKINNTSWAKTSLIAVWTGTLGEKS